MWRRVIGIVSLIVLCLPLYKASAGYNGPVEIHSGPITDQNTYDNELGAEFVVKFFVRSDGSYVEMDAQDNIRIYGSSGLIGQFNVSQGSGLSGIVYFFEPYIYVEGTGQIKNNIYVYDYAGTLKSTIKDGTYTGDFESALSNGDFITQVGKSNNYYRYSLSGQLLKTYTNKPLEMGIVQKQPVGNRKYKTTITYDDKIYVIVDRQYTNFQRDENRNLYTVEPGFVNKFSPCGKLLGQVKIPSDVVFREENVEDREPVTIKHDIYGQPQIDIHGNVYTWKNTPTKYSILKWTWVDDPNVPTGPDAPSGLAVTPSIDGLYLTWTASPNDPGCVTKYEIARATTSGGVFSTAGTVEKGILKYNDTSATVGTQYYYKVRAMAGSEYSPFTAEVSGKR